MKTAYLLLIVLLFSGSAVFCEEPVSSEEVTKIEEAERSFGLGYFRMKGFRSFVEPSISFIKRKEGYSEVIEYSWRPLWIRHMPDNVRIDRIRFSFNRYYYSGSEKKIFYGAGLGGHLVLFNRALKDWAKVNRGLDLKDGLNALGRVFFGYKLHEITFGKTVYPVVLRFDAFLSPDYKFAGELGRAGEKLRLTEFKLGISFSIE